MANGDLKKSKISTKLIAAKVIAVTVFIVVMFTLLTEVLSVAMYGIPYLSTEIARNVGVGTGADWVGGSILWFLPSMFLTIILAILHVSLIKVVVKKMWRWMIGVMRKSSY